MIQQLVDQLHKLQNSQTRLEHQLEQLLRRLYGRSAEKIDPNQLALFQNLLEQMQPAAPATAPQPAPAPAANTQSSTNGHGRRKLPTDLPRQRIVHDLPEDEKLCPCCGKMRQVIGEETSEQLEYVPAKLTVLQHVRLKYACRDCEQNAAPDGPQITVAEKPLSPIEKGLAGPGLLSYVMVSKYGDHLPLHRLEHILERHGLPIARSTMCDWAAQSAEALKPLYDLMVRQVLSSKVIHTDDTPVDVLDRNLNQTRTGRFWVYLGDYAHPCTVFSYTASRSRDGPMKFLNEWGKDHRVYLQADAFGGYDGIYRGEAGGKVIEAACWAHVRRKAYEAQTSDPARSTQALAYIRLLYDVENEAKKLCANEADPRTYAVKLASERLRLRQQLAVPRLQQIHAWMTGEQVEHGGRVLPKSPMGQAMQYALNQWAALNTYVTDGDLAIDNNAAENALRRIAVGRKNWNFLGSDNGGNTAAILFSLMATCQRHKIDPLVYLRDVLTRIAAHPYQKLAELLPNNWKAKVPAVAP